jgi:thiol:disulfide interchange protein
MASNYHRVESPADLQAQLSADLNRVSVLYFRADWAEPCKTMDAVTHELANRSPDVLFLSVRGVCQGASTTRLTDDEMMR